VGELSYGDCRELSRQARGSEFGDQALRTVRPRGTLGLFRTRAPLALMLYIADREDRLVRQDMTAFILIEEPVADRVTAIGGGLGLTLLRLIDRHWDALLFAVPTFGSILAGAAMVPFGGLAPAALVLLLLGMLYVLVVMGGQVLRALRYFFLMGSGRMAKDAIAVESLPGGHWHVPLCHQGVSGREDELLQEASTRLVRLVARRIHRNAERIGARVETVMVSQTLVVLVPGVTTTSMRKKVHQVTRALLPFGPEADVVIMTPPYAAEAEPDGSPDRGEFLLWWFVGTAVLVGVSASMIANRESAACARPNCAGHPATYWEAVRWLLDELVLFADTSSLTTQVSGNWLFGWLMRFMGLTGVFVFVVATRQFMKHANGPSKDMREATVQSVRQVVLVLVVKANERNAVMEAVKAVNGKEPRKEFRGEDTVWNLGAVGGAQVLLGQGPEPGGAGPIGMTMFASRLMVTCDPDYVVLTGICYGLRDDEQRLGDVLVSRRLENIDSQRLVGAERFATGHSVPASGYLLGLFMAAEYDWKNSNGIHFGLMLGSDTLFDSTEHRKQLKKRYPKAIGGEMEGESVYSAAAARRLDWIVVKSISDWGHRKNADHQALATRNAAEFVVHTIRAGGFTVPCVRKSSPTNSSL